MIQSRIMEKVQNVGKCFDFFYCPQLFQEAESKVNLMLSKNQQVSG